MLADVPEPWHKPRNWKMALLQERYHVEVRPFINGPLIRNDGTLAFWVEMINEVRQTTGSS